MTTSDAERQRASIRLSTATTGLTSDDLWLRYFALGGDAGSVEVDAFLHGAFELDAHQRDLLALASNEELQRLLRETHVPFTGSLQVVDRRTDAAGALVELLNGTHLSVAEELPRVLDAAAAHLGVTVVLYVADHAREVLVPMLARPDVHREPLQIDSTLAGHAFRVLRSAPCRTSDGQRRVWVPVVDGVERIGVLDVMVDNDFDLTDPTLRRECWWLSHYVGHLLSALDEYGDGLDAVRRRSPRGVQAELIWSLLPPLTAGTDRVAVSGRLDPADTVGGDVFDYALSSTSADFAILDATGHDLRAGLTAASALAAYRNARREGLGLIEQARRVNEVITGGLEDQRFATGVLAHLDTGSGLLRYVAAGHPPPLLVRSGRVVKQLAAGRRILLGVTSSDAAVGEEQLEPDDAVVLYTDGITEARDAQGREYGVDRLSDVLHMHLAESLPLPEIVRRVMKAVLRHQGGVLQDDATLLVVQWTSRVQAALDVDHVDGR